MNVAGIEVVLPGGLIIDGNLERKVKFIPPTGKIEFLLIESNKILNRPSYVTAVLSSAISTIGNKSVKANQVSDLCIADRQYLMLRLAAMLCGNQMWLQVTCANCNSLFDVDVRRSDLPVKQAGKGYPIVNMHIKECEIKIRVPTGADQQNIADCSEAEAIRQLLRKCILSVNEKPPGNDFLESLDESDLNLIDLALEDASPSVCNQLAVKCPECSSEQHVKIDHYDLASINKYNFYNEIHTLALNYHWSENEILDLPKDKRRLYLEMISRSAGMIVQQE